MLRVFKIIKLFKNSVKLERPIRLIINKKNRDLIKLFKYEICYKISINKVKLSKV